MQILQNSVQAYIAWYGVQQLLIAMLRAWVKKRDFTTQGLGNIQECPQLAAPHLMDTKQ